MPAAELSGLFVNKIKIPASGPWIPLAVGLRRRNRQELGASHSRDLENFRVK